MRNEIRDEGRKIRDEDEWWWMSDEGWWMSRMSILGLAKSYAAAMLTRAVVLSLHGSRVIERRAFRERP